MYTIPGTIEVDIAEEDVLSAEHQARLFIERKKRDNYFKLYQNDGSRSELDQMTIAALGQNVTNDYLTYRLQPYTYEGNVFYNEYDDQGHDAFDALFYFTQRPTTYDIKASPLSPQFGVQRNAYLLISDRQNQYKHKRPDNYIFVKVHPDKTKLYIVGVYPSSAFWEGQSFKRGNQTPCHFVTAYNTTAPLAHFLGATIPRA